MAEREQETSVVEVLITEVKSDQLSEYIVWSRKIQEAEAKFPGFLGAYLQAPKDSLSNIWITLLQFDTQDNLDNWLNSEERQKILEEAESFVKSVEGHRISSPYAGWFSKASFGAQEPAEWKETMLVLLVLFPLVMLQKIFLMPRLSGLNDSVAMFIANTISVILITFPMLPIAIYFMKNWLKASSKKENLKGLIIVLILYFIEICIFYGL